MGKTKTIYKGKQIITPTEVIDGGAIVVVDGKIEAILREAPAESGFQTIELTDGIISPGFIDIHIHGGDGYDVMDGTYESLNGISTYLASTGTTGFLATTVTAEHEDILTAIHAAKECKTRGTEGASLLGVHLEGPFINIKQKGAQNPDCIRTPDHEELMGYIRLLEEDFKLITLAPEMDPDNQIITTARSSGVTVSAGHSCCSYEDAIKAFEAGVSHGTHLFNGMNALHHREPGLVGALLTDSRVSTEVIADGIHLHPATIRLVLAAKGLDKTVLITDCIRAGNLPDGDYASGGLTINVNRGIARTKEGNLAGSTLSMIRAVENVVKLCDVPLDQAVHLASRNPANVIGLGHRKGTIEVGKDADFIAITDDFEVLLTVVEGKVKFTKPHQ
ncbi:N-acetylglucosamine-6-phosphate deacetylase [Cohnella abietis]|uniref:N-acetylglucosamine-6-phosphate deacetylase n=1 Tax=Cohnella abietis TaxID=2507935 RepID=A0A3T1DDW4_9BACL|nr:N-acetylglucosamine-6-phosphate deacetylase [Cohnella abietis]BBI36351.1 N-acetylglucosamine-6-phosphate deacetylase [Cohnella abietis]